jgi:hypothetical protein
MAWLLSLAKLVAKWFRAFEIHLVRGRSAADEPEGRWVDGPIGATACHRPGTVWETGSS